MNKPVSFSLRPPVPEDGMSISQLVTQCPPLDTNSLYCNLLQCTHFAETSVAAEVEGELVGFISGYVLPDRPDTLFIWQVAASEKVRGQGLATRMLKHILARQSKQVSYLETTITESNLGSWTLFKGLSKHLNTELETSVAFDKNIHFANLHDTEQLLRIGPFTVCEKQQINSQ